MKSLHSTQRRLLKMLPDTLINQIDTLKSKIQSIKDKNEELKLYTEAKLTALIESQPAFKDFTVSYNTPSSLVIKAAHKVYQYPIIFRISAASTKIELPTLPEYTHNEDPSPLYDTLQSIKDFVSTLSKDRTFFITWLGITKDYISRRLDVSDLQTDLNTLDKQLQEYHVFSNVVPGAVFNFNRLCFRISPRIKVYATQVTIKKVNNKTIELTMLNNNDETFSGKLKKERVFKIINAILPNQPASTIFIRQIC